MPFWPPNLVKSVRLRLLRKSGQPVHELIAAMRSLQIEQTREFEMT